MDEMIRTTRSSSPADDLGTCAWLTRFVRHRPGRRRWTIMRRLVRRVAAAARPLPDRDVGAAHPGPLGGGARQPGRAYSPRSGGRGRRVRHGADSALDRRRPAQRALLPASGRSFPPRGAGPRRPRLVQDLKAVRRRAASTGRRSPTSADYGPAHLAVDDPDRVCDLAMGDLALMGRSPAWDLDSPLNRPSPNGLLVTTADDRPLISGRLRRPRRRPPGAADRVVPARPGTRAPGER